MCSNSTGSWGSVASKRSVKTKHMFGYKGTMPVKLVNTGLTFSGLPNAPSIYTRETSKSCLVARGVAGGRCCSHSRATAPDSSNQPSLGEPCSRARRASTHVVCELRDALASVAHHSIRTNCSYKMRVTALWWHRTGRCHSHASTTAPDQVKSVELGRAA